MPNIKTTLILALCAPIWLTAQGYTFRNFSLTEGLPQSQVTALAEDGHGYLWAGTQGGGLCRFDGTDFQTFNTSDGLPSNYISAIAADREHPGAVWAGGNPGLTRIEGKKTQCADAQLVVNAIEEIGLGQWLIGTANGLWLLKNGEKPAPIHIEANPKLDASAVLCLRKTKEDQVLVGAQNGLWIYDIVKQQAKRVDAKIPPVPVYALAHKDNIWFAALWGEGVARIRQHDGFSIQIIKTPGLERVFALYLAPSGALWMGTQLAGLFYLKEDSAAPNQITETDGLPHNHVRALLGDHNGNIWVGTSGGGLAGMNQQAFRHYSRSDGLPGTRVYALATDAKGRIWASVSQEGLVCMDSSGLHPVYPDSGFLKGIKCRTLTIDQEDNIWAGTEGRGILVCLKNGERRFINQNNGLLPDNWVQKVICGPDSLIWVATASGLARLWPNGAGGYSAYFYKKTEIGGISALALDRTGQLWAGGFDGRIFCLKNNQIIKTYGQAQGLPNAPVNTLVLDASGKCWAALRSKGVWVQTPSGFSSAAFSSTKLPQNVYLLLPDPNGAIWVGSETGVDRWTINGHRIVETQHYGKNEGFTGIETCQDAALAQNDGTLWFGTMNGLMRYFPGQKTRTPTLPPLLHFEQISLFYQPIESTAYAASVWQLFTENVKGLELPWTQNHLSFGFRGVDLQHAQHLQYRWMLEGADPNWSPLSPEHQVNYANLAPGTYLLQVQCTANGRDFSAPIRARFSILPPFWQRWWFYGSALVGVVGLTLFFSRQHIKRVRRLERERREKLETQNKLLQLEQKALQLQMNPHFIFNALNGIQSLIATQDYTVARQEIGNFAKLMRSTLNNARQQSISLQEEIEMLQQYLALEMFCQKNPFEYKVELKHIPDPEDLNIPPMLLQPFVENAVIHGVSHLNYPGLIQLSFELRNDTLLCRITDNGIGREKAALLREAKRPGHQSAALQVTQERLAALGGSVQIRDAEGGGTAVIVELPVEPNI